MDIFYPLELLSHWLTYSVFGIAPDSYLGSAVSFFIADIIKIFILLVVIIFAVSIIRTYLPPEKIRHFLSRKNVFVGNILASLLGMLTPFCTCSAIPLFLGFVEAGVPLGVTFSFLVASPMINEVAVVLLLGLFGWQVTVIYITSGLIIAIISGLIIGRLKLEKLVESFVFNHKANVSQENIQQKWKDRIDYGIGYTKNIVKKVWLFIVAGVGLGAWIHGYVPADFLVTYAGSNNWFAVPLVTLIGVPLYSNAAGIIPLVSVLTEKGVAVGTTLAFMMSVTALSLPEFLILRKVMKTRLILIFASIVGLGIMFTGYIFNLILQ